MAVWLLSNNLLLIGLLMVATLHYSPVSAASKTWSYTDQDSWADDCGGSSQSPINIVTSDTVYDSTLDAGFTFASSLGDNMPYASIENKGYTFQYTPETGTVSMWTLGGNGLTYSDYTFLQFHFHFGTASTGGSEHTLNGKRYMAEVHFVFLRDGEATSASDSLTVLGFFIDIGTNDHEGPVGDFFDKVNTLTTTTQTEWMNGTLSLNDFIPLYNPDSIKKFYHYQGSLTTPPCYETVNWFVFEDPLYISQTQYDYFLAGQTTDPSVLMSDTFRETQATNGRTVYRSMYASDVALNTPPLLMISFAAALVASVCQKLA